VDSAFTIIYDYFSPAYKAGGPTQSLVNLVKALGNSTLQAEGNKEGTARLHAHDSFQQTRDSVSIRVICTDEDLDGAKLEVERDKWIPLSNTRGKALVWYASEKNRDIERLIAEGDVLFINSIFSHHFSYASLIRSKAQRKIVSPRGMLDAGSLSQKAWKKKLYLQYWKLRGFHRRVEWHATTEQEKQNIQRAFGENMKIWVVPNFPRIVEYQQPNKNRNSLKLITVALISPMKNYLLILKALRGVRSDVQYDIYGPVKDKSYWEECQQVMKQLPANITVNYREDVEPDNVPQALSNGEVAIMPSKSENFGHSIFEAFTAGKPVITSHYTPWNSLRENLAGRNVSIEAEGEISAAIEFFAAMDQKEFLSWSRSAREYALRAIDIESIAMQYLAMFRGGNQLEQA
jgi:glycosyltransferase involved in cell wall biosynthesis